MQYPNLLTENIYDSRFSDKFLVVGNCVPSMYPRVIKKFEKVWKNVFVICLEREHYNMMMAKLFDIVGVGKTKKIGFLTVDGSPHCIQVHFGSKYLKIGSVKGDKVEYKHYVIKHDGSVYEVPMEDIDKARDLATLGRKISIKL